MKLFYLAAYTKFYILSCYIFISLYLIPKMNAYKNCTKTGADALLYNKTIFYYNTKL